MEGDLGPVRVRAREGDHVALHLGALEKILQQTGLAHAGVPDDPVGNDLVALDGARPLEPGDVLVTRVHAQGQLGQVAQRARGGAFAAHRQPLAAVAAKASHRYAGEARGALGGAARADRGDGGDVRLLDGVDGLHGRLQRVGELERILVAIVGVLLERLAHHAHERVGDVALGRYLGGVRHRRRQVHQHHLRRALGLERQPAGEQLEQDDAHGVEVAAAVDRIAAALLGRHVVGRAAHDARAGDVGRRGVGLQLGQAEVDHLDEVAAAAQRLEDDVLGLQIAVHDLEVVRFAERVQHLLQHVDDALER